MNSRFLTGLAAVALGSLLSAPALAGGVNWSVGINGPIGPGVSLGTVISGGRAPVWVQEGPVTYAPEPRYYPAPVYAPAPVYYGVPAYAAAPIYSTAPRRVFYGPAPVYEYQEHHRREHRHERDHEGDDEE